MTQTNSSCETPACASSPLKKSLRKGVPITALFIAGYAGMQGWKLMQGAIDAPTFKRKLAMATATMVGGLVGSSAGLALGGRLPLVPRGVGHFVGGALGGFLGTRAFADAARRWLGDAPQ